MANAIVDILKSSVLNPAATAVATQKGNVTYLVLAQMCWCYAVRMREEGVTEDSCTAIAVTNPVVALVSIMAVGLIGGRWVQATTPANQRDDLGITHLLHDAPFTDALFPAARRVLIDTSWRAVPADMAARHIHDINGNRTPDDVWMISQSSGTTGTQKFMELSYANFFRRNAKTALTHDFRPVITASLFARLTGPWVSYNLRTLRLQGTLVMGKSLDFMVQSNVQKVFGSPKHFDQWLEMDAAPLLPKLPIAHVAGATLPPAFANRILGRFNIIHNFYGGTEVGGVARNVLTGPAADIRCVGAILAGNEVAILCEAGSPSGPNEEGRVAISNNVMVDGYLADEEATRQSFRHGWFLPGDLGFLDAEGLLYLTGRLGDVVNVSGSKTSLSAVETLVAACPGVADAACGVLRNANSSDELMLMVKLAGNAAAGAVMQDLAEILGKSLVTAGRLRNVCVVPAIPRNENGKISRAEVNAALLTLSPVQLPPRKSRY